MSKEKTPPPDKVVDMSKKKKGIVLQNEVIETFQAGATEKDTADNFIDIILFCLNSPDPKVGFTPKTMMAASALYKKLELAREDSEFSVTIKELTEIKAAFNRMPWGKILPGVVDFAEYMETL